MMDIDKNKISRYNSCKRRTVMTAEQRREQEQSVLKFCKDYMDIWIRAMNTESELLSSWRGSHLNGWTKAHMKYVLYKLAEEYHYKNGEDREDGYATSYQKEYYRVDFTMYSHYDEPCCWTLDYAIEHENDEFELNNDTKYSIKHKGWFDEFAKLLPLKCAKARVIISYDYFTAFDKKLEKCRELLKCDNIQPSLADSPILLIIFPRTKQIEKICEDENSRESLIHIVYFNKRDDSSKEWVMKNEFEKEVIDDDMNKRLLEVYKKIYQLSK